jgi:hypothetical protein
MSGVRHETVEEFLARGGTIQYIPNGVSGLDPKKADRNIQYSKTISEIKIKARGKSGALNGPGHPWRPDDPPEPLPEPPPRSRRPDGNCHRHLFRDKS